MDAELVAEQHEEWQYGERRYLSETSVRRLLSTLAGASDPQPHVLLPLTAGPAPDRLIKEHHSMRLDWRRVSKVNLSLA